MNLKMRTKVDRYQRRLNLSKMKWAYAIVGVAIAISVAGCMARVVVDKRPPFALPVYSESSCTTTNPVNYIIVDQGYEVRYMKFGFSTDI